MISNVRTNLILSVILVVLLSIIGYRGYKVVIQKEGYFMDEVYSFYSANKCILEKEAVYNAVLTGEIEQFANDIYQSNLNNQFSYDDFLSDCYVKENGYNYFNAYFDQMADVHPPLYYIILHTVSSITKSSDLILIGFSINILFLLLTCLLIYKLVEEILKDKCIAMIAVAYYGFSYEFANVVIYFRMYCLCAFEFTLLLYLYRSWYSQKFKDSSYTITKICIVQLSAVFTQYYSFIAILPLVIMTIYNLRDNLDLKRRYIKTNIICFVLYVILWPAIIYHIYNELNDYNAFNISALFVKIASFIKTSIEALFACNMIFFITVVLLVIIMLLTCFRQITVRSIYSKLKQEHLFLIVVPSFVYFSIVIIISPWSSFRYISPIMPALFLLFVVGIYILMERCFKNKTRHAILAIMALVSSFSWNTDDLTFVFKTTPEKKIFEENFSSKKAIILDGPNILYLDVPLNHRHTLYIHTIDVNAENYLSDKMEDDQYILYMNKNNDISIISDLLMKMNYSYSKIDYKPYFWNIYRLKKNN